MAGAKTTLTFFGLVRSRTTGYLLGFPTTLFLSTVLWALHRLMSGVENLSVCPKPLPMGGRWLSPGNLTRFPDEGKI